VTSRIGSPDTAADEELRACLDHPPTRNFIMVAGAGSGKTTSLVKALGHLERTKGASLRRRGQQIACITFTRVAVGEIWGDVGNAPLFHVSTIHSFLWTIVHSFQSDIRDWVAARLREKIADAEEKIARPLTRPATRVTLTADIARFNNQLAKLPRVPSFKYSTGSNYEKGQLGDDDILRIGPALIEQYPLMRTIVAQRFPFIFVDESQDTNPDVVVALKRVAAMPATGFCLGFFGDPMQKIYPAGAGPIGLETEWLQITKPENFRCATSVLGVINGIRAEADGLVQVAAARIGPQGPLPPRVGTARLFIVQAGSDRSARLNQIRQSMAALNADPLWESNVEAGDVRMLVLVHRIAATRLGFGDLYAALHDSGSSRLKDGLLDGTVWMVRPFMGYLLSLVMASRANEDFAVISALRNNSPLLAKENLAGQNVAAILAQLKIEVDAIVHMFRDGSTSSVKDVLNLVRRSQIGELDPRFTPYLTGTAVGDPDDEDSDYQGIMAFLATPVTQLWGYRRYVESESPFDTQQGIKGAEFQRVLVVLDDEESNYRQFSYSKYWGIEALSARDLENIAAHTDSVLDRTRRLFYVCCSRALQDLAVVFFVPNTQTAHAAVLAKNLFAPEDVHVLDGPLP
jgi:DNA helicase II / ATP-dependent DNA helicase PcrA